MSSKNTNPANDSVDEELKNESENLGTVPEQGGKVTVLKDASGKDQVIISDEEAGLGERFKKMIRNKKVLAGLGAFAAIVVVAIIKNAVSGDPAFAEGEYTHNEAPVDDDEDYRRGLELARKYDEEAAAASEHTD